jgi:hypothetical protein
MGNATGITMQGLATARKKPPAQEQWRTMEKTMRRAMGAEDPSDSTKTVRVHTIMRADEY